jgi:hypothetical protein
VEPYEAITDMDYYVNIVRGILSRRRGEVKIEV